MLEANTPPIFDRLVGLFYLSLVLVADVCFYWLADDITIRYQCLMLSLIVVSLLIVTSSQA
jgi:hypothetical protein